jgi:hypothetical protein
MSGLLLPGEPGFQPHPERAQCEIVRKETDEQCRNVATNLSDFVCVKCLTGWRQKPICDRCMRKAKQQQGTCQCGGDVILTAKPLAR